MTEQSRAKREELKDAYGLTAKQIENDTKRTEQAVSGQVERVYAEHKIAEKHLEDELKNATTASEIEALHAKKTEQDELLKANIVAIVEETMDSIVPEVVTREETKAEKANQTMDDARSHLRSSPGRSQCSSWHTATAVAGFRTSTTTPLMTFSKRSLNHRSGIPASTDSQEVTEADGSITTSRACSTRQFSIKD